MFVPRYDMIVPHIKVVASVDGGGDQVLMPAELFRFLLRCALEACEFDEAQYQQCNPGQSDWNSVAHDHFR